MVVTRERGKSTPGQAGEGGRCLPKRVFGRTGMFRPTQQALRWSGKSCAPHNRKVRLTSLISIANFRRHPFHRGRSRRRRLLLGVLPGHAIPVRAGGHARRHGHRDVHAAAAGRATHQGGERRSSRQPVARYHIRLLRAQHRTDHRRRQPRWRVRRARQLTLRPNADNVTEYRYQVNGGAERSVAAGSDGTATITVPRADRRDRRHRLHPHHHHAKCRLPLDQRLLAPPGRHRLDGRVVLLHRLSVVTSAKKSFDAVLRDTSNGLHPASAGVRAYRP